MRAVRIRTGVALVDGQWRVVVNVDGELLFSEERFASGGDAERASRRMAADLRRLAAERGDGYVDLPVSGEWERW